MPVTPQLELQYDVLGKLSGGACSACGVNLWIQDPQLITEEGLNQFFRIHLQARHPQVSGCDPREPAR